MAPSKRRDTKGPNGLDGVTLDRAFAKLRPAMFALAYRITGNRADAEEIVQDAVSDKSAFRFHRFGKSL
jgi:Sigma-70 region 2